eukprot:tig00000057_g130.t1
MPRLALPRTPRPSSSPDAFAGSLSLILVFCGFLVPRDLIPQPWIWMYYLSFLVYPIEALAINELKDLTLEGGLPGSAALDFKNIEDLEAPVSLAGYKKTAGEKFTLRSEPEWVWRDIAILVLFMLAFGAAALAAWSYKESVRRRGPACVRVEEEVQPRFEDLEGEEGEGKEGAAPNVSVELGAQAHQHRHAEVLMTWRDLGYSIKDKQILTGVTAYCKSGMLMALMGPSGAGKTTLLDVLAGRKEQGKVTGDIQINGRPRDQFFHRLAGYVEQFDLLIPEQTVREAIVFSALLRLPSSMPKEEKIRVELKPIAQAFPPAPGPCPPNLTKAHKGPSAPALRPPLPHAGARVAQAEDVIDELDLRPHVDLLLGCGRDPEAPGQILRSLIRDLRPDVGLLLGFLRVSYYLRPHVHLLLGAAHMPELRKRVSIGIELVARPAILFLDEPTSGLDAVSALHIMHAVRKLARAGQAVIWCVHLAAEPEATRAAPEIAKGIAGQAAVCTVHQPSAKLFEVFDWLLLLRTGGEAARRRLRGPGRPRPAAAAYFGPLGRDSADVLRQFDELGEGGEEASGPGYPCPPGRNPADFVLEVCGGKYPNTRVAGEVDVAALWRSCPRHAAAQAEQAALEQGGAPQGEVFKSRYAEGFQAQVRRCLDRNARATLRRPAVLQAIVARALLLAFVGGSMYYNNRQNNLAAGRMRTAAAFYGIFAFGMGSSSSIVPKVFERTIMYREATQGAYHPTAAFLAWSTVEFVCQVAETMLFDVVFYFFAGLTVIDNGAQPSASPARHRPRRRPPLGVSGLAKLAA